jgi:hypothetical protein
LAAAAVVVFFCLHLTFENTVHANSIFLQQTISDTGLAVSLYQPDGSKNIDDPGECICNIFGYLILFS